MKPNWKSETFWKTIMILLKKRKRYNPFFLHGLNLVATRKQIHLEMNFVWSFCSFFIYFQPVNIYLKKFTKHSFEYWTMMAYLTRDWHFHLEWVIIDCVYAYIISITLLSRGKLFHKIYHQWEMFVCEYFQLGLISIVSFGVWLAGWGIIIFLVAFLLLQILATWNKSYETHWIRQGKIQRW